MHRKLYEILMLLSPDNYQTARSLSQKLGISEKTVRNRIKDLNDLLTDYGAEVASKQHYGYLLVVRDRQKFLELSFASSLDDIPNSADERQRFLLHYLLTAEDFVKIDDLSERLFVSRNTLSASVKRADVFLIFT